jgi:hypothetical protein
MQQVNPPRDPDRSLDQLGALDRLKAHALPRGAEQ